MRNARLHLVLAATVLAGCGDGTTQPRITPADPGRFAVELTGANAAALSGPATISTALPYRQVLLEADDATHTLTISPALLSDTSFDFQIGTYAIGPVPGLGDVDIILRTPGPEGEDDDIHFAVGGELRISESTAGRIVGEMDVSAVRDGQGSAATRIRGAFHALP